MLRSSVRLRQQCRNIQLFDHPIQHRVFSQKLQKLPSINEDDIIKTTKEEEEVVQDDSKELTLKQYIKLYKTLSKWNLSLLNGIVTGSTAFICSGGILFGVTLPATIGCISLAISASSLNQLQEYKCDQLMQRTKFKRPLCTGKLSNNSAAIWSILSMTIGASILTFYCGSTAAVIGISTLFMYNAVYTPLKRITPYNTEFGAIVGALPPQIGIAASHYYSSINPSCFSVLFETINDPLCWYSFLLLYTWQMPHFLYLSVRNKEDYIRGGFKMWSGQYEGIEGDNLCKKKSLLYTSALLPLPALLSYSNITSWMFAFDGTVLNMLYLFTVYKWYNNSHNNSHNKCGKSSFYANLLYLPSILFLMIIHSKRWKYRKGEFWSTHLACLQNKGTKYCLYDIDHENGEDGEDQVPSDASCTSPFRL